MAQRMLSARTTWDALVGLVLAQCIDFFRPMVTCFLGLVVFHWIKVMHQTRMPPLEKSDLAYVFALKNFAPEWGVRGIVLAGPDRRRDGHFERAGQLHVHPVFHRHLQEVHQ